MAELKRWAVFPGTFDPITNGHLDVIRRGLKLFDGVIVAVGDNPDKSSLLSQSQRVDIVRRVLAGAPNARVEAYNGLTVDFAKKAGAAVIIRGLRNTGDMEYEIQSAWTNRKVSGIETVFIMASAEHAFTSSNLIRQIATEGGDVSAMVPPEALEPLSAACKKLAQR